MVLIYFLKAFILKPVAILVATVVAVSLHSCVLTCGGEFMAIGFAV